MSIIDQAVEATATMLLQSGGTVSIEALERLEDAVADAFQQHRHRELQ